MDYQNDLRSNFCPSIKLTSRSVGIWLIGIPHTVGILGKVNHIVISVYAPTAKATPGQTSAFYDNLQGVIDNSSKRLIVCRDFNARTGLRAGSGVGKLVAGARPNKNTESCRAIRELNDLRYTGSCLDQKSEQKTTWLFPPMVHYRPHPHS
jgi:hypothetical protein